MDGALAIFEDTDAALAVLRRLTPEQEAAAEKAAQRIGEVAAAAEAAPEEAAAEWLVAWPGGDLDAKDEEGWSALQRAAEAGQAVAVAELLRRPSVEVNGVEPTEGQPVLVLASRGGHAAAMQVLLACAEVNVNRAVRGNFTALLIAAQNGHGAVVELLLAHAAVDVNQAGEYCGTPLYIAALNGNEAVIKLLLAHAAIDVNQADERGMTPLYVAAQDGHEAVVELLLAHAAIDANQALEDGRTPLFIAAEKGKEAMVELLLAHAAVDPNQATQNGRTPLFIAAEKGKWAVVELLLVHAAVDPNQAEEDGTTPLFVATQKGKWAVVELLLAHAAIDANQAVAVKAKLAERARAGEAWVAEAARLAKEARALEKALVKTAEELVAEAELAELRRLTPEQEAAAAEAAQRIGEVAAAAEAAAEEERAAAQHPAAAAGELWALHGGGAIEPLVDHTPLIDLEYLVALAEGGGVMPCGRQNVPPAALITARNLWRLKLWGKANMKGALGVLVLSYPWLDWFHPDRLGAQLRQLLPFLKAMLAEAKRDSPHCTVGVMIDFLCLPQRPFATEDDGARFGVSLKAINAWYFHPRTYTLLVTDPPPEGAAYSNTRLHRDRGWCFFEQAASMVVKVPFCLLDFGAYKGATEFTGGPDTCLGQMKAGRAPPIAPDAFGERMRARVASGALKFTSNADMEFVIGQYEAGFVAAINHVAASNVRRLYLEDLGWGDAEAAELLLALRYAAAKCAFPEGAVMVVVKEGNPISETAMATLPPSPSKSFTYDQTGESVDWGAPGEARHAWKGKFFTM